MFIAHNTHLKPNINIEEEKNRLKTLLGEGRISEKEHTKFSGELNRFMHSFIIEANKLGPRYNSRDLSRFNLKIYNNAIRYHNKCLTRALDEEMYRRTLEQVKKLKEDKTD